MVWLGVGRPVGPLPAFPFLLGCVVEGLRGFRVWGVCGRF
jgi:hypothetical protein